MAHVLHRVLEAAELLKDQPGIVFLFAGGGAQRTALVEQGKTMGLTNVHFLPRQDKALMPRIWSLCDVSLIQLKDDPLFSSVIPSKIFESMGMGLPIILSLPDGEAAGIVRATGAGVVIPPEQPDKLAQTVLEWYQQPDLCARYAKASADAATGYSRAKQAERMARALEWIVEGKSDKVSTGPSNEKLPR